MVKIKEPRPDNIRSRMEDKFIIRIADLRQAFKAYETRNPVLRLGQWYLPDTFKNYFKKVKFNLKDNSFEFIINDIPLEVLKLSVYITKSTNFINTDKYDFYLNKAEYVYREGEQEDTIKIRKRLSNNCILIKSIFDHLNNDGSLEEIYKKSIP